MHAETIPCNVWPTCYVMRILLYSAKPWRCKLSWIGRTLRFCWKKFCRMPLFEHGRDLKYNVHWQCKNLQVFVFSPSNVSCCYRLSLPWGLNCYEIHHRAHIGIFKVEGQISVFQICQELSCTLIFHHTFLWKLFIEIKIHIHLCYKNAR